ncbi:FAD-dependent oxidoreductase [Burkholderia cepacia]|uniref:FAD-dependent oxidoreductase n=1 Tax=Burkholderia cepacia TaxID=292 RepID=UPI002AB680A0|nr:FAD-dependent oxidoreductase [Burkholderia cepacia]
MLNLGYGLIFSDLYCAAGLQKLDGLFLDELKMLSAEAHAALILARERPEGLPVKEESSLLLQLAPFADNFIEKLFGIGPEASELREKHVELASIFYVKRMFVQRRVAVHGAQSSGMRSPEMLSELLGYEVDEFSYAGLVEKWLKKSGESEKELDAAASYARWALYTPEGRRKHGNGVLFQVPGKRESEGLPETFSLEVIDGARTISISEDHLHQRDGFKRTDPGVTLIKALDQVHYCVGCHAMGRDSCSKGMPKVDRAPTEEIGTSEFQRNANGVRLSGCPLEEKISEFQSAKSAGLSIAALAIVTIDNPFAAATGHRICNECMRACIYQKQDPVNIPQAESRTLQDVLELPWGFEIYSLLTRWNPLNIRKPYPGKSTGYKVLVAGMGPAGMSLSHYLLNDGHTVVGIDGLKIEPLPSYLNGVSSDGSAMPFSPIKHIDEILEPLDERIVGGFGGVAEYGITVRWDKNNLKILRLLLERRSSFSLMGGIRFGGTLGTKDAQEMGFDHIALALGAGKPTTLNIPNGVARGVRTASDFLMALQLSGPAKTDSLANLQVRLPVVVIGGGLTAIDTATEALAYYVAQVEKFLYRHERLVAEFGDVQISSEWTEEEHEIVQEFLAHARAIRAEREAAAREARAPRIVDLVRQWGGATVAYRRKLSESPAFTLNAEEVEKALEEGIFIVESVEPVAIEVDRFGAASGATFRHSGESVAGDQANNQFRLRAKAIFIAAGTQPNTVLANEDEESYQLDGKYFQTISEKGIPTKPQYANAKPRDPHILISMFSPGKFVSAFGDMHPSYSGNVVKALASAKQGYPIISRTLGQAAPLDSRGTAEFRRDIYARLNASVYSVRHLAPSIVEVTLRAPQAAKRFRPGQFYRLNNFECNADVRAGTRMSMEAVAVTGAWVDKERGLVSVIVLDLGGSSALCSNLKPGSRISLMGPTGAPTEIRSGENVVLVGGGLGNAVLFSIGQAFRAAGSKVLYFAGYKRLQDRYKVEDIEAAADAIVWCCDERPGFSPTRRQDVSVVGNIIDALELHALGNNGNTPFSLRNADRLIVIGSDKMMAAVAAAREGRLSKFLKPDHVAIGSINSPMQCMMKEVCGQCIQLERDPNTGVERIVFSCAGQDQELSRVDFGVLGARLMQNSVSEKLTKHWIQLCKGYEESPGH